MIFQKTTQPNTRFHVKWFPEIVFSQNKHSLNNQTFPTQFSPHLGVKTFLWAWEEQPAPSSFSSLPLPTKHPLKSSPSSLSPKIHSTKHTLRLPSHDKQKLCKEMVDKGGLTIIYSIHMWLEVLFGKKINNFKK